MVERESLILIGLMSLGAGLSIVSTKKKRIASVVSYSGAVIRKKLDMQHLLQRVGQAGTKNID